MGYSLLGAVVEKLSSKPVNDYIQVMLGNKGILVTSSDTPPEDSRGMVGQVIFPSGLDPIGNKPAPTDASGGWIMDAENMSRFLGAVHNGEFLHPRRPPAQQCFPTHQRLRRSMRQGLSESKKVNIRSRAIPAHFKDEDPRILWLKIQQIIP